ncbi:ice-binding family protein, partial [Streptosporangium sp. OZ121]|uniref:ice-binding family protein n=1 Tax=Streptosporangium sp. OZ121 TaxID=3444183 RepID=UPI003F7B1A41
MGLGTAGAFAVLAGSTVTNTGATVVTGGLGLSPGTAVTGFPPGTVNGAIHAADAVAAQAKVDLVAAYNDAASRTPSATVGTELGGTTVTPGVYTSAAGTFGITGTLTLDAQGDSGAVFVFQAASTLITASASTVVLTGGAQARNVFWQVGSSATLGTGSSLAGNVLALTSITVTTGVSVNGRVLARNGAVTLDTDTITKPA